MCVCLQSQTEARRTDGGFRRRLTHRNQAITHSMTPPEEREREGEGHGGEDGEKKKWGRDGGEKKKGNEGGSGSMHGKCGTSEEMRERWTV